MKASKGLTWNDRLALIEYFNPSDSQACLVFGVEQNELDTARSVQETGVFKPTADLDVESYSGLFASPSATSSSVTSIKRPKTNTETVTKTPAEATTNRRGRKGNKIANAFAAVPSDPTSADSFSKTHGVSLYVLRQGKRFDKYPELGVVHVKKDKDNGELMIWRETTNV